MNSLSWFLYLANVVSNLSPVLFYMIFVCGVSFVILSFVYTETHNEGTRKKAAFYLNRIFIVVLVLLGCLTILPSKETVYAIAASEFGESILTSEAGQQVLSALKEWTLSQLKTK